MDSWIQILRLYFIIWIWRFFWSFQTHFIRNWAQKNSILLNPKMICVSSLASNEDALIIGRVLRRIEETTQNYGEKSFEKISGSGGFEKKKNYKEKNVKVTSISRITTSVSFIVMLYSSMIKNSIAMELQVNILISNVFFIFILKVILIMILYHDKIVNNIQDECYF